MVVLAAFAVVACGGQPGTGSSAAPHGPPILNTATVEQLVTAFADAGLPVPNAHDVTQVKCPPIDCTAATDSDTVEIIKFPNTGAAQRFAGTIRDVYQIEDIALVFTHDLPGAQRAAYEQVVHKAVAS